jgi:hypothetical protein
MLSQSVGAVGWRAVIVANMKQAMLIVLVLAVPALTAQSIDFATAAQGRELLTTRDDFVTRMSPFDRAARMKTDRDVTEEDYLRFVAANVREWAPDEKAAVEAAWAKLKPKLDELRLPFPKTILFVKTTGEEEADAEYTRGAGIVLPQSALAAEKRGDLPAIVAHELFHVLSRNAPELRDRLYAVIGFHPCGEIVFPQALAARRITNPDAPKNDHAIQVRIGAQTVSVVPILYANAERYDVAKDGPFVQYLKLSFLVVDGLSGKYDAAHPMLLDVGQLQGFFEQVGRNTEYIIHPEEILADNFRMLLLGQSDVKSPEILTALKTALAQ